MKQNGDYTKQELIKMLMMNLRDMNNVDISSRNIPNLINRAKATAMGVSAIVKLEGMELRRIEAMRTIEIATDPLTKKLKPIGHRDDTVYKKDTNFKPVTLLKG